MKLIYFAWFMILSLMAMCFICGCSKKCYPPEKEDYQYIRDPLTYIEPFQEDTICSHLFVKVSIPCDNNPDSSVSLILNEIGIQEGFICVCVKCFYQTKCY